jgi:hypothetical protein
MELILGSDWGSYLHHDEQIQFNWQQLYDEAGVRFAVFRGDQEQIDHEHGNYSTLRNLEASRRVLPVNGCYYWHFPDASQTKMLAHYKKAIDQENPDFIAVDLEQTRVLNPDTGKEEIVNPKKFSDTARQLCEGLRSSYPEKQVVVYTRRDIITKYAPKMIEWIADFDGGWEAAGIDYGLDVYTLTFEQIKQTFVKQYPTGQFVQVDPRGTTTIPGWTHNKMHQYSTRIKAPYEVGSVFAHQSDWNVFFGSVEDMLRWVRKEAPAPAEAKTDWASELVAWARRQPDPYTGPGPE